MISCSVFVGDRYLGEAHRKWAFSTHYFCEACGNVWARILAPGVSKHLAEVRYCRKCWDKLSPSHQAFQYFWMPLLYDEQRYPEWQTSLPLEAKLFDLTYLLGLYHADAAQAA